MDYHVHMTPSYTLSILMIMNMIISILKETMNFIEAISKLMGIIFANTRDSLR